MSRTWIVAVAAVLTLAGGLSVAAPARAEVDAPAITPSSATSGDEMTAFTGTGSGFTPNGPVDVTVTVDSGSGPVAYTGGYTKVRTATPTGSLSPWTWIWSYGDPYGTYVLTFTDHTSRLSADVTLTINHTETAPAAASGTHLMLDTRTAPPLTAVQTWQRAGAPYNAIGVYVPVVPTSDNRSDQAQANLTSTWISAAHAGGWHTVPVYVGLQAPAACQTDPSKFHTMDATATVAQSQGVAAADDAVGAANALGIDAATPLFYDLESYNSGCSSAVHALLGGWVAELHRLSRRAGVYGSVGSTAQDAATLGADVFWAATDNRRAAVDSVKNLPAAGWKVANQYLLGVARTYGDSTLVIDESAVDDAAWTTSDTTAPIVALGHAPELTRTTKADFDWSGVDAGSGLATYQVRTRRTPGGHPPSAWSAPTTAAASARGATTYDVKLGEQVCVEVRATDNAGNTSDWTPPTCTSRLADDRTAMPGAGWHRTHKKSAYRHTLTTASRKHAVLRLGHAAAGRLGVVHSGKGAVVVRVGGRKIGVLRGSGTTWVTVPRGGQITLTTATSRKVAVDGFVLLPR